MKTSGGKEVNKGTTGTKQRQEKRAAKVSRIHHAGTVYYQHSLVVFPNEKQEKKMWSHVVAPLQKTQCHLSGTINSSSLFSYHIIIFRDYPKEFSENIRITRNPLAWLEKYVVYKYAKVTNYSMYCNNQWKHLLINNLKLRIS